MMSMDPSRPPGPLRRWGPLAAVLAALVVVSATVLLTDAPEPEEAAGDTTATVPPGLPEGVMPYSVAEELGTVGDIDWGARCDTETGRLAMPLTPPSECYAPWEGDNGGETTPGVDADTVRVVVYLPQPNDPILSFIYDQIGLTDTNDDTFATFEGYSEMLGEYYETYGREVELIRYEATGSAVDPVTATADAETIARDIRPFMVLGGPAFGSAFADTLAANGVMCSGCTQSTEAQFYIDRAPYVWSITSNRDQDAITSAEYVGRRLAGRDAVHGGEAVRDRERVFGYIHINTLDVEDELTERFEGRLAEHGVQLADVAGYDDPLALAGQAREILARMKDLGVTTILFRGDPLAPQTLTQQATQQDYFPEWVLTGSILVDTTIFARTYEQSQWQHAFGPSSLFARVAPSVAGSAYAYEWFWGEPPPAGSSALIAPSLQFLYAVVQGMGPEVDPLAFQRAIFNAEIIEGNVLSPQISWGDRGFWPFTDYSGIDDATEIWWDPGATGPDEIGQEGRGMWAYANGGERFLAGGWPESAAEVFDDDPDPVTLYTDVPEGLTVPDYEPLPPPK